MAYNFIGKISRMGDNKVIWIPKEFHSEFAGLEGKQVKITIGNPDFETLELLKDKFLVTVNPENRKEIIDAMASFGKSSQRFLAYVIQLTIDPILIQYATRKITEINRI